jgi:hypothetical protein
MFNAQPIATNEVRIKLNHLMGWGFVLPSFLPSSHFLNSSTLITIRITEAIKKSTWKNLIMGQLIYWHEVKVFGDNVSSNHTTVFLPGKAPLLKWLRGQIHGTKEA